MTRRRQAWTPATVALLVATVLGCDAETEDPCAETASSDGAYPVAVFSDASAAGFCAIHSQGGMKCWGDNTAGQFGAPVPASTFVPRVVDGVACAVEVGLGSDTTCVRLSDGTVRCLGSDDFGTMGNGLASGSFSPKKVRDLDDAVALASKSLGFAVVRSSGEVWAWGLAEPGGESDRPRKVSALQGSYVDVVAASGILCATPHSGSPECLCEVPLPDGGCAPNLSAFQIVGRLRFGWGFACGLSANGQVVCWGENLVGQLGRGTTADSMVPMPVTGLSDIVSFAVGAGDACAINALGEVLCWGGHACDSGKPRPLPFRVELPSRAVSVAVSYQASCAVLESREVWCWGEGTHGELGVLVPPEWPGGPTCCPACRDSPMPVQW